MVFNLKAGQYKIVQASELDQYIMETYGYDALYLFRYADGSEASVKFTPPQMEEFQPNRSVSEMMEIWRDGMSRRREHYEQSLAEGFHPYWSTTRKAKATDLITKKEIFVGHAEYEFRHQITKSQREFFEREIERLKVKEGDLICEKIV